MVRAVGFEPTLCFRTLLKRQLDGHYLTHALKLVHPVGNDPTTPGLSNLCSATELRMHSSREQADLVFFRALTVKLVENGIHSMNVLCSRRRIRTSTPSLTIEVTNSYHYSTKNCLEPPVRFELTTYRLQGDCTTTVLRRHKESLLILAIPKDAGNLH